MEKFSCEKETCPWCKARGECHPHGSYRRNLIDFTGGRPVYDSVRILRVKCHSCGHTHAILPDFIIPYASYSLYFILRVLTAFFRHTCTVEKLCLRFSITPPMLYRWKALFLDHRRLWLGALKASSTAPADFLRLLSSFPDYSVSFASRFVLLTGRSFLQSHRNPADYRQTVF